MGVRSAIAVWGSTAAERALPFPCDRRLPSADQVLFRAVSVDAPAAVAFRWICQLRAAPYSYDWIDNRGRRSPQQLIPGLEALAVGQRVQRIFRLDEFETGASITITATARGFGQMTCTYRVDPVDAGRSRIVVKILGAYPAPQRRVIRLLLAPGDLVMMRRQLLNLKRLAERTYRDGSLSRP